MNTKNIAYFSKKGKRRSKLYEGRPKLNCKVRIASNFDVVPFDLKNLKGAFLEQVFSEEIFLSRAMLTAVSSSICCKSKNFSVNSC